MDTLDTFEPKINSRPTEELLEIAGSPEKWEPEAVALAQQELTNRNIKPVKIEMAGYLAKKRQRIEDYKKANEGYTFHKPIVTLFIMLFAWEHKKDGYYRKARQQKRFRLFILVSIIIYLTYIIVKATLL
ncbi:MAG: hypothetical protein CMP77_14955 [Flavobacterium sp.]|nr:hypothetical protein [Flavobacterium sp.]|tara:strand:- start:35198 stop:35587 length:390 start_codon:yes stop_codon:yes gene_type:complete